ncbi:MAG: RNA-binding protein [Chitinispirillia bacterium]|nr:RNA-binding protein [Chitinispirillia bacterium]MCL2241471.1 RNA-binding protein [Chitinispirillia bacterium]
MENGNKMPYVAPAATTKKLYVGNLPYHITEGQVRQLFRRYEPIHSIIMVADRDTRISKGYGFVELEPKKAEIAMDELDQKCYMGRNIKVSNATGVHAKRDDDIWAGGRCCLSCPLVRAVGARMMEEAPRAVSA